VPDVRVSYFDAECNAFAPQRRRIILRASRSPEL
jgi:hypothetical protein